jgi:hypothetical protein
MVADVRSLDPAVAIDNAGKTRSPDYARGVRCRRSASSGKMLRRTVRQCRKGAYTRKRGKQRCAAFRRGYVQGGRERVSDHRAHGEDGNCDVMVRACPRGASGRPAPLPATRASWGFENIGAGDGISHPRPQPWQVVLHLRMKFAPREALTNRGAGRSRPKDTNMG